MSDVGLTLRDVFLKGGDLFPGVIPQPEPEPDSADDDEDVTVICSVCAGSGEGLNGPPGTGTCRTCHGSGEVSTSEDEGPEDDGDRKYDEMRDREMDDMIEREG